MTRVTLLLLVPLVLWTGLPRAQGADGDPLERTADLVELARAWMDVGMVRGDPAKVRAARARLAEARSQVTQHLATGTHLSADARARARRLLDEIEDRSAWCTSWLEGQSEGSAPDETPSDTSPGSADEEGEDPADAAPEIDIPPLDEGAAIGPWAASIAALYRGTQDVAAKAALAAALAARGGVVALPLLTDLFDEEQAETARPALHQALADVGTPRLAAWLRSRTARRHAACWPHALDVLYRVLERPEAQEPERPYLAVVRAFHQRRDRKLTLGILERLDALGREGVAALGEVLYVGDFGYHTYAIERLATKRDSRAVPPLVFKMNRFRFDAAEQFPAHDALLQLGWHAVPGLIDRLDDKAAGIWISWTLRKITGETMGTDKRKWHDWWKGEQVRHPELFKDPDERPPGTVTGE